MLFVTMVLIKGTKACHHMDATGSSSVENSKVLDDDQRLNNEKSQAASGTSDHLSSCYTPTITFSRKAGQQIKAHDHDDAKSKVLTTITKGSKIISVFILPFFNGLCACAARRLAVLLHQEPHLYDTQLIAISSFTSCWFKIHQAMVIIPGGRYIRSTYYSLHLIFNVFFGIFFKNTCRISLSKAFFSKAFFECFLK